MACNGMYVCLSVCLSVCMYVWMTLLGHVAFTPNEPDLWMRPGWIESGNTLDNTGRCMNEIQVDIWWQYATDTILLHCQATACDDNPQAMGALGSLGFDTTVGEANKDGWIWLHGDSPCRGIGMVHACGCETVQNPCRHVYVNAAFNVVLSHCTEHLAPSSQRNFF